MRWNRMQGRRVLWLPGLDHAGIATQVQVEKLLWQQEKLTRNQIGREEFLKRADKWKDEKSKEITTQVKTKKTSDTI